MSPKEETLAKCMTCFPKTRGKNRVSWAEMLTHLRDVHGAPDGLEAKPIDMYNSEIGGKCETFKTLEYHIPADIGGTREVVKVAVRQRATLPKSTWCYRG